MQLSSEINRGGRGQKESDQETKQVSVKNSFVNPASYVTYFVSLSIKETLPDLIVTQLSQ